MSKTWRPTVDQIMQAMTLLTDIEEDDMEVISSPISRDDPFVLGRKDKKKFRLAAEPEIQIYQYLPSALTHSPQKSQLYDKVLFYRTADNKILAEAVWLEGSHMNDTCSWHFKVHNDTVTLETDL